MLRCVRGGCGGEVKAALGYDIRAQRAWMYDLDAAAAAAGSVAPDGAMALCARHADNANVPQGWGLTDSRTTTAGAGPVLTEPVVAEPTLPEPVAAEPAPAEPAEVAPVEIGSAETAQPGAESPNNMADGADQLGHAATEQAAEQVSGEADDKAADTEALPVIKPDNTPTRCIIPQLAGAAPAQSMPAQLEQQGQPEQQEYAGQREFAMSQTPLLERAFRTVPRTNL